MDERASRLADRLYASLGQEIIGSSALIDKEIDACTSLLLVDYSFVWQRISVEHTITNIALQLSLQKIEIRLVDRLLNNDRK